MTSEIEQMSPKFPQYSQSNFTFFLPTLGRHLTFKTLLHLRVSLTWSAHLFSSLLLSPSPHFLSFLSLHLSLSLSIPLFSVSLVSFCSSPLFQLQVLSCKLDLRVQSEPEFYFLHWTRPAKRWATQIWVEVDLTCFWTSTRLDSSRPGSVTTQWVFYFVNTL